jgi:chromosome segregation ATPase
MRNSQIEDALDEARGQLDRVLAHRSRLEKTQDDLQMKLSKLRVAHRQGQQNLKDLREAGVVLLSEYENIKNLTASIQLEIKSANNQLAENFQFLAANRLAITDLEKAVHDLVAMLSKQDDNVLEFKRDVRRSA